MAMNRGDYVTEICDTVGKSESAASRSGATLDTRVRTYLNWAQKRLCRFYDFYELNVLDTTANLVTDVKVYPLMAGTNNLGLERVKDIASIRLNDSENSRTLQRWLYRKFDRIYPRPENYTSGRPTIYTRWKNSLEFFRIPNSAYSLDIRYMQWPQDLTSDGQESDLLNKDQLIFTAGVFETYMQLQEYGDAKLWYERLLGQVKDAVHAEGDVDWEPEAESMKALVYKSGEPEYDPYGNPLDPLYGYPE